MLARSIRLFVDFPLSEGAEIAATPAQAHYLGTVMRRSAGEALRLFNGQDGEFHAELVSVRRDRAVFRLIASLRPQAPEIELRLLFAPVRRDATDLIVQKATELGATAVLPVLTERTRSDRVNLDRLRAIAMEAAEQCERLTLPRIHAPQKLTDCLGNWPGGKLFAALERRAAPPPSAENNAALLVGPEGGFSPAETAWLGTLPFVVPASLGPLVLRAETAAIAGLVLLGARCRSPSRC